jgi:hypothetical protein
MPDARGIQERGRDNAGRFVRRLGTVTDGQRQICASVQCRYTDGAVSIDAGKRYDRIRRAGFLSRGLSMERRSLVEAFPIGPSTPLCALLRVVMANSASATALGRASGGSLSHGGR